MLQFDEFGFLNPNNIIISNIQEFKDTFVFNEHRSALFSTYLEFLDELEKLDLGSFFQWIDGSFVTKKSMPNDIDIVTFVDFKAHKFKNSRLKALNERFRWRHLDVSTYPSYPKTHHLHPLHEYDKSEYFQLYTKTRPIGKQQKMFPKGFVQINF
jgi:hypothetical protein